MDKLPIWKIQIQNLHTWDNINKLVNNDQKQSKLPVYFYLQGNAIKKLCRFNTYFTNIGQTLPSNINISDKDLLQNPTKNKFVSIADQDIDRENDKAN